MLLCDLYVQRGTCNSKREFIWSLRVASQETQVLTGLSRCSNGGRESRNLHRLLTFEKIQVEEEQEL